MTFKFAAIGAATLVLLAGCQDMTGGAGGRAGQVGTGMNTQIGSIDADTAATTPEGIVATQLSNPANVSECEALARTAEDSDTTEVARQSAIEDRARLGCPG